MEEPKNIRIVDIARMAGVSIGTVDRVLHNRGRVSDENLQKVNAVLAKVNYRPNIIARSLASKRIYHLGVIIPKFTHGEYWEYISRGIDLALSDFQQYHVEVDKRYFDQFNEESFRQTIQDIQLDQIDAVLIAPLFAKQTSDFSKMLDEQNIPYVYIDSDLENEKRMSFVGTNSYAGGRIAARLLSKNIRIDDSILMAQIKHYGVESTQAIKRQKGFVEYLKGSRYQGELHATDLFLDDAATNEKILDSILYRYPQIKAAVIFNSKAYVIGEYLKKRNRTDICLIGYDLIERNELLLQDGYIEAVIAQHPRQQGYEGIRVLCDKLIFSKQPEEKVEMPLDILIQENYQYYKHNKL